MSGSRGGARGHEGGGRGGGGGRVGRVAHTRCIAAPYQKNRKGRAAHPRAAPETTLRLPPSAAAAAAARCARAGGALRAAADATRPKRPSKKKYKKEPVGRGGPPPPAGLAAASDFGTADTGHTFRFFAHSFQKKPRVPTFFTLRIGFCRAAHWYQ